MRRRATPPATLPLPLRGSPRGCAGCAQGPKPPDWERIDQARVPSPMRPLVSEEKSGGHAADAKVDHARPVSEDNMVDDGKPDSARSVLSVESDVPAHGGMAGGSQPSKGEREKEDAKVRSALEMARFMAKSEMYDDDEAHARHVAKLIQGWCAPRRRRAPEAAARCHTTLTTACLRCRAQGVCVARGHRAGIC